MNRSLVTFRSLAKFIEISQFWIRNVVQYWSPIHQQVLQLSTTKAIFDYKFGKDWVIDPNRFRLAQPKGGSQETAHTDHSSLDPKRKGRPATIISLSNRRTFCWYQGTAKQAIMQQITDYYKAKLLKPDRHYVTFPITEDGDPLSLLPRRTQVQLKLGDVLIFNDNLLHEVAVNKTKYCQFSIFLSPRCPNQPPLGRPSFPTH